MEKWQMEDARRLAALYDSHTKLSQREFGATYGIGSQGMVSQYVTGHRPLNIDAALAFAEGLQVGIEEISPTLADVLRKAHAKIKSVPSEKVLSSPNRESPPITGYVRIPLLDARHGLGELPVPVDVPEIIKHLDILEDWVRRNLSANPRNIAIFPAFGDSMKGTVEDGSIVFVDIQIRTYSGDGLYSVIWQNALQVKRLQAQKGGLIMIISDNTKYPPQEADENLLITGKFLGCWNFFRP